MQIGYYRFKECAIVFTAYLFSSNTKIKNFGWMLLNQLLKNFVKELVIQKLLAAVRRCSTKFVFLKNY